MSLDLTDAAQMVVRSAGKRSAARGASEATAADLLQVLIERHPRILQEVTGESRLTRIAGRLAADDAASLPISEVVNRAAARARQQGRKTVDLVHLAETLLGTAATKHEVEEEAEEAMPTPDPPRPSPEELEEMLAEMSEARERTVETPALDRYGRDLTALASEGELEPVIGREHEIDQVIEVISRTLKRNPLLVGPPGVGKTAVVEGLAQRVAEGQVPEHLSELRIVELSGPTLRAVSRFQSDVTALINRIVEEATLARCVLFIDEFHVVVEPRYEGEPSVAAQMKPALARGSVACIGATTEAEYHRIVQRDPAIDRRFEPVQVNEPDTAATAAILEATAERLAEPQPQVGADVSVELEPGLVHAVMRLGSTYLHNRRFPDKGIDILDRAIARARLGAGVVTEALLTDVVADMTGLPIGGGGRGIAERINGLADYLRSRVIGQEEAIEAVTEHLTVTIRNLDIRPERPNGVFLFTGPTGVGKTEMARAIAEHLFGSADRLIRLDMSEYSDEELAITRLLGSTPGYVGYEEGSAFLDEVTRRPFTVILLDEIEKADPAVHRLFLQVFDAGVLTSGQGRPTYFSDAVIIMTSNIVVAPRRSAGFVPRQDDDAVPKALTAFFPQEFLARIDAVCRFRKLTRDEVRRVLTEVVLPRLLQRYAESGIEFTVDDSVIDHLTALAADHPLGLRELNRILERELLAPLALSTPVGTRVQARGVVEDGTVKIVASK